MFINKQTKTNRSVRGRWRASSRASHSQSRAHRSLSKTTAGVQRESHHTRLSPIKHVQKRDHQSLHIPGYLPCTTAWLRCVIWSRTLDIIKDRKSTVDLFSPQWDGSIHPRVWSDDLRGKQRSAVTVHHIPAASIHISSESAGVLHWSTALHLRVSFLKNKSHPRLQLTPFLQR